MSTELEFVNYNEFVESLPERTSAASGDKTIVSNPTDGPGSETNAAQAQKVLAGNVAQAFDPTRTSENPYKAGESVVYNGKTYTFKVDHYGAWVASDVYQVSVSDTIKSVYELNKDFSFVLKAYEQGGFRNTNGQKFDSNAIVRNADIIPIEKLVSIELKVGATYIVYVYSYDSNGNYIDRNGLSVSDGASTAFVFTGGYIKSLHNASYVNFAVYNANGTNLSPSSLISANVFYVSISNAETFNSVSENASNAISQTENIIKLFSYVTEAYEQGGFRNTNGQKFDSSAIVRNADIIPIEKLVSIELKVGATYIVYVYSYDSNGNYIDRNGLSVSDGASTAFVFTGAQIKSLRNASYVNFAYYNKDQSSITPSQVIASGNFVLTLTNMDTITKMDKNTNSDFSKLLYSVGKTPMATWVDDDGDAAKISTIIIPSADTVGVPVTFAMLPTNLENTVTIDGVTMTRAEYFLQLQEKGHHITSHPVHKYWYGANYDITKVNPSLIQCLTTLQEYGFLHSDLLVYPGDSAENAAVVEIVRKWCECGVRGGYNEPNHLGDSGRWNIRRTFVDFEAYYTIHHSDAGFVSSMAFYKSMVDIAEENGDWIVFGSHSYLFTDSDDTSDPNANTKGNILELMQYVVTKGLEFRTLWDAYNRRKYLFYFKEMNN